jgi:TM2 domain-containing membrane protein YozV
MFVQRTSDPSVIEARLLELAHTTDVKLTAPVLAYYAPCAIEDAAKVLDGLATKSIVTMEVDDDGVISYELVGRQKLSALPTPAAPAMPTAIVHHRAAHQPSALLAGLLSVWLPGAGHLYAGRLAAAIVWFLVVGAGYVLILPGLILHLFCIISAASAARLVAAPARYQLPMARAA